MLTLPWRLLTCKFREIVRASNNFVSTAAAYHCCINDWRDRALPLSGSKLWKLLSKASARFRQREISGPTFFLLPSDLQPGAHKQQLSRSNTTHASACWLAAIPQKPLSSSMKLHMKVVAQLHTHAHGCTEHSSVNSQSVASCLESQMLRLPSIATRPPLPNKI